MTLVGQRFGRLLVVAKDDSRAKPNRRNRYYSCLCDCGNTTSVRADCLSRGIIQSCRCLQLEMLKTRQRTHGESKTPFYKVWIRIHDRCKGHLEYSSKGITVCERWKSYENFREDMFSGYAKGLTIDRIDNAMGYFPENCRWVTNHEQARNKTTNKLTHESVEEIRRRAEAGEKVRAIAKEIGVNYMTVLDAAKYRTWVYE